MLCEDDLVVLSDQDDVLLREKISAVVEVSKGRPGAVAVFNDTLVVDENLAPRHYARHHSQLRLPDFNLVSGCCAAFRREWQGIALPMPDGAIAHYIWLVGLAHRLGAPVIEEKPLHHIRHPANVSENLQSTATDSCR